MEKDFTLSLKLEPSMSDYLVHSHLWEYHQFCFFPSCMFCLWYRGIYGNFHFHLQGPDEKETRKGSPSGQDIQVCFWYFFYFFKYFLNYFFSGLECAGHPFANVTHFVFFWVRDVWIWTQWAGGAKIIKKKIPLLFLNSIDCSSLKVRHGFSTSLNSPWQSDSAI